MNSQNDSQYFMLYANCIPVKGHTRSVICDLQKQRYRFIPNLLYKVLALTRENTMRRLKEVFENQYDEGIEQYFNALHEEDYGFYCSNPALFPELSKEWDYPAKITNAIIDIDGAPKFNISKFLKEIQLLGCKALQLRFYSTCSLAQLQAILDELRESVINSIEIFMQYDTEENSGYLCLLPFLSRYPRAVSVICFASPYSEYHIHPQTSALLCYTTAAIQPDLHCGIVHPDFFTVNNTFFMESQGLNNCLNRKLSIDKNGEVKNCPSMQESFGKYDEVDICSVVASENFQRYWRVSKNEINDCKVCEFRYICPDCRVYTEESASNLGKPSKCTYNPYLGKWEN